MSLRGPNDPDDGFDILSTPGGATAPDRSRADLEHLQRLRAVRRQRLVRAGLVVAVLVVLIVFVLQNAQPVRVNLVFLTGKPRLIWVIVFSAALGGIVGYLLGRPGKPAGGGKGRSRKR